MQEGAAAAADNYRGRQVSFWKKHQTMVQLCADLTNRCGAKVLVSRVCVG